MLVSDNAVMIRLVVVFVMSITETQPTTTAHAMSPVMQETTAVRMQQDFAFVIVKLAISIVDLYIANTKFNIHAYLMQLRLVMMLESTLHVLLEGCLHRNAMFLGAIVTVIHSVHSTVIVVQMQHNYHNLLQVKINVNA